MNNPRVTVITVVYNDAIGLKSSIASVLSQQYDNVEYIVVDGGSTDDTQLVLKEHSEDFSCCISEPDNGTYDAMNKALSHATGEWVIFMNAGDCFYRDDVLQNVFSSDISPDVAIIGGDIMAYSRVGLCVHLKAHGREHRHAMPCSHQAAFIRRNIHLNHPYDFISFPICADYACMCSILESGYSFQYTNVIVAWFDVDGISSRKCFRAAMESRRIPHVEKRSFYFYIRILLYEWKQNLFRLLPWRTSRFFVTKHLQRNGWSPISNQDRQKLALDKQA